MSVSQQFTDALEAWQQAPATALFCVVGGTTQAHFVIVPSAADAPADATCVTRGGAPVVPQPVSTLVTPPPGNGAPPLLGPVVPAPVQDIVIERPTPPSTSLATPTPGPRPAPTPTPAPPSPPRRTPTPTAVPLDADGSPRPTVPSARYAPTVAPSRADERPAGDPRPSSADQGSADTAAGVASVPPSDTQLGSAVRTLAGLRLGPAVADYFGQVLVTDPFVLLPGKLFLGGSLLPLQTTDGIPLATADAPFSFTLSPEAAAPLAGSGRPGPFRVFAFNADSGAFDELPTSLVLYDDGSVMVTVLPPAPPPSGSQRADVGPSQTMPPDASSSEAQTAPSDEEPSEAVVAPVDRASEAMVAPAESAATDGDEAVPSDEVVVSTE